MRKTFALLYISLLAAIAANAQDTLPGNGIPLRHIMTNDERSRSSEIGKGFLETDPPVAPVRNVAEFDRVQGVLIAYPSGTGFGIPMSLIREMASDVTVTTVVPSQSVRTTVLSQYVANGVDTSHCDFLIASTNSYWTRDYGPWFVTDSADQVGIVDFTYNRPRPLDDLIPQKVATMLGIPWYGMNLVATGGNYMCDGYDDAASTELIWDENPSMTHDQIDQKVKNYLGIQDYHVRPDPNGTYIFHIDCWGKFLAPDKILIRKVPVTHPQYAQIEAAAAYWDTATCPYGYPYQVYRVNTPQDQPYTNSVIVNNKVLMPFMNSQWDDSAKAVYQAAMPGYEVIGFTGLSAHPWESTDALHCRVMGIADIGLLHIRHVPVSGTRPCEQDYAIEADIYNSSRQPVIADSVLIRYRVNDGPYLSALMSHATGRHYTGLIPRQPAGSVIRYYLAAADESGRHAFAPFIGAADPYSFQTVYTNLTAVPDTLWFETAFDCINGKITQVHNYLEGPMSFDELQMNGTWPLWWVDSVSVTLPHVLDSGDSVAVRVKVSLPVRSGPLTGYETDSMRVTTAAGAFHVIIMVNGELLTAVTGIPDPDRMLKVSPNPFRDEATIGCRMAEAGMLTVEIRDINGNLVRMLASSTQQAGDVRLAWDGTDAGGRPLPGGIYLCRAVTADRTAVTRIVVVR